MTWNEPSCFRTTVAYYEKPLPCLNLLPVFFSILAAEPVVAEDSLFERDVLPILTKNCLGCHGGLRQKGKLDLRTIASALKGGESGPALKPGDLEDSEIWQLVSQDEMPPDDRKKLTAADKEHLKKWIAAGLPTVAERQKNADTIPPAGAKHEPRQVAAAIDQHIQRGLADANLRPMPTIGDAEFLRRIYLDLAGRVPTAEKAAAFLDSSDPDKRARLIDELLKTSQFAEQFGRTWREWIVPPELPANINAGKNCEEQTRRFGQWMGDRVLKGDGWDEIVRDILTAQGKYRDQKGTPAPQGIFFQLGGTPDGYPLPGGAARLVASTFMGVQIRCAECHDDPYKNWSQEEFWALGAFFQGLYATENFGRLQEFPFMFDKSKESQEARDFRNKLVGKLGLEPRIGPDRILIPKSAFKNVGTTVQTGFLKGEEFRTSKEESLRPHFAAWLTRKDNPYFAKAFANRMWFYFFARGIVHPVDDFRDLNPPSHPGLIAMLANEFSDSGFDVKHLLRCICNSETYQRSSMIPPGMNEPKVAALTAAYGRMPMRLMGAEVFYNSLKQVYGADLESPGQQYLELRPVDSKNEAAIGDAATVKDPKAEFVRRFCNDKEDVTQYIQGIPQRLTMLNHPRLLQGSKALDAFRKPAKSAEDAAEKSPEQIVQWLYLSTLSRRPTEQERNEIQGFLEKAPDDYMSILWSLINRSEYQLIR